MLINREVAIKAVQDYGIAAINAGRKSLDVVDDKENVHYCADGSLGLSDFQGWKVGDASG